MSDDTPIATEDRQWDVVIIGTGMGGGTLGHSLARQGLSVLFLEKGLAHVEEPPVWPDSDEKLLRAGRWPGRVTTVIDGLRTTADGSMGIGIGGTTQIFGAAMERFERRDFESTPDMPHPTGGWPFSYDVFAPYYEAAERLYRVRGTRDPLGEIDSAELPRLPPASPVDGVLMRDLARAGLAPYRQHVGIGYKPGCIECLGYKCQLACKSEAGTIAVVPATTLFGADLRTECDVVRIEADATRATGVVYRHGGALHRVTGRAIVLSAGAYRSPVLMLASRNDAHPDGIGNARDQVGRNIMFHSAIWLALWPSEKAGSWGPRKTISTRAFMNRDGVRGGLLHSTGMSAGYGNILVYLYTVFDRSRFGWLRPVRPFLRIPAKIAEKLFGSATILSINIEDLPYPKNRVRDIPGSPDDAIVYYTIPDELRARTRAVHAMMKAALGGIRKIWLNSDIQLNLGHPCGTCRAGHDPQTSVVDSDCRVHGMDNLYVVDASFMPTSGGSNPSLTIAANALRVGDILGARLKVDAA